MHGKNENSPQVGKGHPTAQVDTDVQLNRNPFKTFCSGLASLPPPTSLNIDSKAFFGVLREKGGLELSDGKLAISWHLGKLIRGTPRM